MNKQQLAFAASLEPEHNWEYPQQHAEPMRVAGVRSHNHAIPRRSPLPSVREIDDALERKYGAPRYREI
jgi:hypothetical protein